MLTMYFNPTIGYAQQEEAEKAVDELVAAAQRHADGFKGAASGWAVELIKHESLVDEVDKKGMAFLVALGWESVDAHTAFRETKEFKRFIEPLRDVAKGMEMVRSSHAKQFLDGINGSSITLGTARIRKRPRHERRLQVNNTIRVCFARFALLLSVRVALRLTAELLSRDRRFIHPLAFGKHLTRRRQSSLYCFSRVDECPLRLALAKPRRLPALVSPLVRCR